MLSRSTAQPSLLEEQPCIFEFHRNYGRSLMSVLVQSTTPLRNCSMFLARHPCGG